MRTLSVTDIKSRKTIMNQQMPRDGTKLRQVYDLFQRNKGNTIEFAVTRQTIARQISDLRDYYGLDIIRIGKCQWVLAGEWFGRVYIDYIANQNEDEPNDKTT